MDKRIIEFLESGVCEGLYTITVKEYPIDARGVVKGYGLAVRDEECEECDEMTSGGVSVGEVWGALSLDERIAFLDGCERVLGRNYLEVENLDFETVSSVLRAEEMVRGLRGYGIRECEGSALPLPNYGGCVVVIGKGKYFEDTMRRIAIYNGIYYEINARIFGVIKG